MHSENDDQYEHFILNFSVLTKTVISLDHFSIKNVKKHMGGGFHTPKPNKNSAGVKNKGKNMRIEGKVYEK